MGIKDIIVASFRYTPYLNFGTRTGGGGKRGVWYRISSDIGPNI